MEPLPLLTVATLIESNGHIKEGKNHLANNSAYLFIFLKET